MSRLRPLAALVAAVAVVVGIAAAAGALGTDPGLPQQWGLRQIGAPTAWSGGALIGSGVPIAIVDTGVDLGHEDLRDRISAAVTCVDTGGDPAKCRPDGQDIEGHGSHVAGIAAATANNVGVSGVAPGARILAIRVFQPDGDDFSASSDDINAGIRWAVRNVAAKGVINLSVGGNFVVTNVFGSGFDVGIEDAWKAGWLPVLASGNENMLGLESSNYGSLDALVVGATGPDDKVASYSSETGSAKWALLAPGGDASPDCEHETARCILSTYKGGQYGYLQGTSMATPHVAGAGAILMGAGMTNAQAVQRLLDTADRKVACGGNCRGRLDLAKATAGLAPATPGTTAAPAPSSPSPSPTAAPAPATPAGSGSSSGGRRTTPVTASSSPTAAAAGTAPTTGAPAPDPSAPAAEAPPAGAADADAAVGAGEGDGSKVTDLSISAARRAAEGGPGDDGAPLALVLLAVAAAIATAAGAFRRWSADRVHP